ncbi:hypothetical protein [Lewinella cohaerens]|uniref:hypothetical protein n=1 Tax=Lewinella cohaerens TaxID=70995 RepID=UPI00036B792F|nr:hypothetical protein [Lewinella cohaerens]
MGKFFSLVLILLTIVIGLDLRKPVLSTTVAVDEEVALIANLEVPFTTAFDYGYKLELSLIKGATPAGGSLKAVLVKKGDENTINLLDEETSLSSEGILIEQYFVAQRGDQFLFKIIDIDSVLIGRSVLLYADVTGGAPSVGLALQREFRPHFRVLFVVLLTFTFATVYLACRNKGRPTCSC